MDLTIFKSIDNHCFNDNGDTVDIRKCSHLQRILHALKYYTILKTENASNADIFMEFCNDTASQSDRNERSTHDTKPHRGRRLGRRSRLHLVL